MTDYAVFMALSKRIGQNSVGQPIYLRGSEGDLVLRDGQPVLDHDADDIAQAYWDFRNNRPLENPFTFVISMPQIRESGSLSFNPVRYLPEYGNSADKVVRLGEAPGWRLERLGDIATVFNGPRFKRPYADEGVFDGPGIVRYFTGTAMTQMHGENIKYLDYNKASATQRKQLDALTIHNGYILITDSGTLGRVICATNFHEGAVATNNLVRVLIEEEELRGYVYQFLTSELGQHQLLRNTYGTIQDHLEPFHVEEVLIPIPEDEDVLREIGGAALASVDYAERSRQSFQQAQSVFARVAESSPDYEAGEGG